MSYTTSLSHAITLIPRSLLINLWTHLKNIQYQAALAVPGTWNGSGLNKLYDELGWESLTDRRWARRLQWFRASNIFRQI